MQSCLFKFLMIIISLFSLTSPLYAQKYGIKFKTNPETGAISKISIAGDDRNMNWLVNTYGSQYPWITEQYGWGLGYFTETKDEKSVTRVWDHPSKIEQNGRHVTYEVGTIQVQVDRSIQTGDLIETYTFMNTGKNSIKMSDVGIYTPFNDNYPDAYTCENFRADVHIWDGESAAYVNAVRMGGYPPHLGLIVTEGSINRYEISARGREKGNSQTRGVISLDLPDMILQPGEKSILQWHIFPHTGYEDFCKKVLNRGGVIVRCNKYVFEKGETARVILTSDKSLKDCIVEKNGVEVPVTRKGNKWIAETTMEQLGEVRFDFFYGKEKQTYAACLVIDNADSLIQKRVNFIQTHQQMNKPGDPRYGAYMVYDNEGDSIYLNNTPNANPPDRDEGGERLGMGVLLAEQYLKTHNPKTKASLLKYADFVHKLQTEDYVTYSTTDHNGRNRGYNYVWVAEFYFQMYKVTGEKQYAVDGYRTLQSFYRQFGYDFYAIGVPVRLSLHVLKMAGMKQEYEDLKRDFIKMGNVFVENGLNYPKSEVNFEQAIVAPAIIFLEQLYLQTGIKKFLNAAKNQMPVLEAFSGAQPSYHLNGIANRHWDDYWFGKREMWGDVFPHYWSTLTAAAYHYYFLCTGNEIYQKKAENIVRNNLCLFFSNGSASCAYVYPYKVNGIKAQFYDPYANDQDWALVYYKEVMGQ